MCGKCCTAFLIILVAFIVAIFLYFKFDTSDSKVDCDCINSTCACCFRLKDFNMNVNHTECINITYKEDLFELKLISDNETVIMKDFSDNGPIPVCTGLVLPSLLNIAKICTTFYDINITNELLYICIELQFKLNNHTFSTYHVGCLLAKIVINDKTNKKELFINFTPS